MKTLALLALLFISCNQQSGGHVGNGDGPPPRICPEVEPNDSIATATFISVFTPPDHITFCGDLSSRGDEDVYRFFAPVSEIVSFVITSESTVPIEMFLYADGVQGHWVGDPGQLVVLNYPVIISDNGFYISISTPAHVISKYDIEMWSPGIVR